MIPRGSLRRFSSVPLGLALVFSLAATSNASTTTVSVTSTTVVPDTQKTLSVSVPGSFNGCSYLDAGATATSRAVLDLIRPSAFNTTSSGGLVGQGGPIVSAELTSLSPETVVYTISPGQHWSNGVVFNATDLVAWWQKARVLPSVLSDGYRNISSMPISDGGLKVSAVFAKPYANWNQLFRDLGERGVVSDCSPASLENQPSLGAYRVLSASASRIVLVQNPSWPLDANRFGHVVLTSSASAIVGPTSSAFAAYSLDVSRAQVDALSSHPAVLSHIGSSNAIEELTFAPNRPLTKRLLVREALSWSVNRQSIINGIWGSVTFSPSVASSALYAQGQSGYPGGAGSSPISQTTTTSTLASNGAPPTGLSDCLACANDVLRRSGYVHTASGWRTVGGTSLLVRLGVGPSAVDVATARAVRTQWAKDGISSEVTNFPSESAVALAVAANSIDAGVFLRPVDTAPAYVARSWVGTAFSDSYPSGNHNKGVSTLFSKAIADFNPVTAAGTWSEVDHFVQNAFWVRPLFTPPSLVVWSSSVAGVYGSLSIQGFLDELTGWNTTTAPRA